LLEYLVGAGSITGQEKERAREFENVPDETLKVAHDQFEARVRERLEGEPDLARWFDLAGVFFALQGGMHV